MGIDIKDEAHPTFGFPVDDCLEYVFPSETYSQDNFQMNTNTENVELALRSHLLTLTASILECTDEEDEEENAKEKICKMNDFISTSLKFFNYVLENSSDTNNAMNINTYRIRLIPFRMLEDVFDTITSKHAKIVWVEFVEKKDILFSQKFFTSQAPKLIFIKLCNKLLEKVSSQVEFAGRIQMFRTAVMSLDDRSGANVVGKFNLEKELNVDNEEDFIEHQKTRNFDDTSADHKGMNYQFYKIFWGIQKFFTDPKSIMSRRREFETSIQTILSAFEGNSFSEKQIKALENKYNSTKATTSDENGTNSMDVEMKDKTPVEGLNTLSSHHYFLTSSHLLHLQLKDPEIRIQFLAQILIICSHLIYHINNYDEKKDPITLKRDKDILLKSFTQIQKRAEIIMKNTPPNGKEYLERLTWTLNTNEIIWKKWKKLGCKTKIEKVALSHKNIPTLSVPSKPKVIPYEISDQPLSETSSSLGAHRPSDLTVYLDDYADALDPDAGIEEEYHPKHNTVRTFRSLRLVKDSFNVEAVSKVRKNDGDLEGVIREIWRKEKGKELPGVKEYINSIDVDIDEDDEANKEKEDNDDFSVGSPMQESKAERMEEILKEEEDALKDENGPEIQSESKKSDDVGNDSKETEVEIKKEEKKETPKELSSNAEVKKSEKEVTKVEHVKTEKGKDNQEPSTKMEKAMKEEDFDESNLTKSSSGKEKEKVEIPQNKEQEKHDNDEEDVKTDQSTTQPLNKKESEAKTELKTVSLKKEGDSSTSEETTKKNKEGSSEESAEAKKILDQGKSKVKNENHDTKDDIKTTKTELISKPENGEKKETKSNTQNEKSTSETTVSSDVKKETPKPEISEKNKGKMHSSNRPSTSSDEPTSTRPNDNGGTRKRYRDDNQPGGNGHSRNRSNHRNHSKHDNNNEKSRNLPSGSSKRGDDAVPPPLRGNSGSSRNNSQRNATNYDNQNNNKNRDEKRRGEDNDKRDRVNYSRVSSDRNYHNNGRDNRGSQRGESGGGNRGGSNRNSKRRYDGGSDRNNGDRNRKYRRK